MFEHKGPLVKRFLYDFFVIVIGVLTAFGLQTFSESLTDSSTKEKYLAALQQELDTNISQLINVIEKRSEQSDSTDLFAQELNSGKASKETIIRHLINFYDLLETTCKLGAYEAFKASTVFDKLRNVELLTKLNNLDAHIELTLDWQSRVQSTSFDLFVSGNNGAIKLSTYEPDPERVFTPEYIEKVKYLQGLRYGLTEELILLRNEMKDIRLLLDKEIN